MRTFDKLAVVAALTLCTTKIVAESDVAPAVPPVEVQPVAPAPAVPETPAKTTTEIVEVKVLAPDHLMMSAGSILVIRGDQKSRLESELRLTDGSIITPGGTVKRPDGSATRLEDGQSISPAGKLGPAPGTTVESVTIVKP